MNDMFKRIQENLDAQNKANSDWQAYIETL
jgi:hypothetical protein